MGRRKSLQMRTIDDFAATLRNGKVRLGDA
jgi:hypothetical protein